MKNFKLLAATLISILATSPAAAHSFRLGLAAPFSGPDAAIGQQALDGLRLATRERDAHPEETSDGHLGGLDSYLLPLDSATADAAALRQQADDLRLDIVTMAAPVPGLDAALEGAIAFCPPAAGPVPADRLTAPEAAQFTAAFRQAFGRDPTPAAARGYNAGRAVDAAVRAQGDASDKAALTQFCVAAQ
jgi:ABC-type branched-subunit amino acid transport system substrate-binding protein